MLQTLLYLLAASAAVAAATTGSKYISVPICPRLTNKDVTYTFRIDSIAIGTSRTAPPGDDTLVMTANVHAMSNSTGQAGAEIVSHTLALGRYSQGDYIPSSAMDFQVR